MASKHANVYLDVAAWPPSWWDPWLVREIDGRCRSKTVWGSNGGVARVERVWEEMDKLPIRDESKQAILRGNAMRIYKL